MNLHLIRHLPTEWNIQGRLQGSKDISIIEPDLHAMQDIEMLKKEIGLISWDRVFVSEKKRTYQTAAVFDFVDFIEEPLINELDFGKYEGELKSFFLDDIGENWLDNILEVHLGESMSDFQSRLFSFVNKYKHEKNILAFSHGAVIRGLTAIAKHGTIHRMNYIDIPNGSLTILKF